MILSMLLFGIHLTVYAQLWTTSPTHSQQQKIAERDYKLAAISNSPSEQIDPFADRPTFSSGAIMKNTYTISVSAMDMASVGVAGEAPMSISSIQMASSGPPGGWIEGNEENDKPGLETEIVPVGNGTGVLFLCVLAWALVRSLATRKKV